MTSENSSSNEQSTSAKPFSSLELPEEILKTLEELSFTEMTPIQEQSLPHLLLGQDLIGQSKTGSGKTAAFALPILNRIILDEDFLQALVLTPTRELATQVVGEIRKLGRRYNGLKVLQLTGGGATGREQFQEIEKGVHIAVGTPGRILDLMQRRGLDLMSVQVLVMDEADKMLEMGFEQEIGAIMKEVNRERQTIFFSATFPDSIQALSRKYQKKPVQIKIDEDQSIAPMIEQFSYEIHPGDSTFGPRNDKLGLLFRVLQQHPAESVMVFCNMKSTVNEITEAMLEQNASCASLHGDLEQRDRDRVMAMFRNGSLRVLVATDVAARGLDIENLELVVNYDFPLQFDTYVHRIGRTGRAGKTGTAVVLSPREDVLKLHELEKFTGQKITAGNLGFKNQHGLAPKLRESLMKTILVSGGRKDKLRPGDIVGALTGKSGGLKGTEVGKIEVHDRFSFVAVATPAVNKALASLREGKIKGAKYPVKLI